ncbi:MAG TPA: HD domain-containing phosphohydrolase [Paucimonas sp.]|nr:HD domain-containing phosphohydrolase [Paucimonas sp.]
MTDIAVGEPLPWDVYGTDKKLLLRKGQVVQNERQVEVLIERGLYIDAQLAGSLSSKRAEPPPKILELPSVLRLINLVNKRLERLLYTFNSEPDMEAKILEVVKALEHAGNMNPDIALGCVLLNQEAGSYAVRHCIDTAIVSWAVLRAMRKPPEEITAVMAAALTMNLGMLRMQDQLQNKSEPLNEKEQEIIKKHPEESVNLLRQAGVKNEQWLSYVLLHHENEDGTGYPRGKDAGEIPQNVKILAIADRYCARIANRKYRKTLLPGLALRDVLVSGGKTSDPTLAAYFVKEVGTYPPGSFVRLQSGEICVVTGRGASPTTPTVHAIIGPRGAPLSFPIKRETSKQLHGVREAVSAEQASLRFSLQQLWGQEAAL